MERKLNLGAARQLSDEDVMELLQSGYDAALQIIIERYEHRIHNFIYRYTHNIEDAEDITQETFLRVYRSKHRYQRIAKFSTWLYTIAFNLTKSHYKRLSRLNTISISNDSNDNDYDWELPDSALRPDDNTDRGMMMSLVYAAMEKLPQDFKEAVLLRDIKNLTYEEIEEITGVPMGTVKSRINRGRAKIKLYLEPVLNDGTFSFA